MTDISVLCTDPFLFALALLKATFRQQFRAGMRRRSNRAGTFSIDCRHTAAGTRGFAVAGSRTWKQTEFKLAAVFTGTFMRRAKHPLIHLGDNLICSLAVRAQAFALPRTVLLFARGTALRAPHAMATFTTAKTTFCTRWFLADGAGLHQRLAIILIAAMTLC